MIDILAEAGADFSISHIIGKGADSQNLSIDEVKALSSIDLDISKLNAASLAKIISILGLKSIKPLSEAGADFSELYGYYLEKIVIKLGIDSIKPLYEAGAGFSKLFGYYLVNIINELGVESVKLLSELGVNFSELSYSHFIVDIITQFDIVIPVDINMDN